MDQQLPDEDWQQTEKSQQVLNQKQHRNPRQWYRSRNTQGKGEPRLWNAYCFAAVLLIRYCCVTL